MDTRIFSAYNEASNRALSAGLTIVDAARGPLQVLKVLMEGLPRNALGGLWFINFKGVPVARSRAPFDLVYLDGHARVVQAIEISPTSIFESFRGSPASAFILPPRTVSQSKTFTGDRIVVTVVGNQSAPTPPRIPVKSTIARTQTRVIPTPTARRFNASLSPAQPAVSGSLLRSASAAIAPPAAIAEAATETAEVSIAASESAAQVVRVPQRPLSTQLNTEPVAPAEVPPSIADVVPESTPDQPAVAEAFPPGESQEPYVIRVDPLPPEEDAELAATPDEKPGSEVMTDEALLLFAATDASGALADLPMPPPAGALARPVPSILRNTWDVRLLYFFFPKLHPGYRPEFQAPRVGFVKQSQSKPRDEGKLTMKLRILCWFYPDLQLETVHLRQREARRAPRLANPGLVGYFFTGGTSKPNEIHNLSVTGFYMKTGERWLPGTVIRVTLQMIDRTGEDPDDTITVHSRVVNWNSEGGGFEFVLPGFVD